MINKAKILYFMPDPPMRRDAGNKTHVLQMLEYFDSRYEFIELDYIGVKEWGSWNDNDVEEFQRVFPNCNINPIGKKMSKDKIIKYFFEYKLPNFLRKKRNKRKGNLVIDDYNTVFLQKNFNDLLKNKTYDYLIISYVTWATLVENNSHINKKKTKLIIDTHDFMTAQFKNRKKFQMGKAFEREIELLSLFDETWSQSSDEQYLFSQFLPIEHKFVPIMYSPNNSHECTGRSVKYDIIYVGSQNDNNQQSINWFFDNVYPLLPKNLRICVIGKICNYFPVFSNVEKHLYVSDLSEYYYDAKIAICPMLAGTGVKVKVVEAMSYGLPIVCNLRGLDGLPIKYNNGCVRADTPETFANAITRLLNDKEYYNRLSNQSRKNFEAYFIKEKCYDNLDSIFGLSTLKEFAFRKEEGMKSKEVV